MAKYNTLDNPDDPTDPYALDPTQSRNALLNGVTGPPTKGITDPTVKSPDPAATLPVPTIGVTDPTVKSPDPSAGGAGPVVTTPFAGGLTPTTPYKDNKTPRIYTGADGNTYTDDPDPNSVSGFILQPGNKAAAAGDPTAMIDALFKQYGIADGGRGSGFADRAYWLEHPSEILNGRLAADLAGTGTDQPTGTPGTGPWQNSGKNGGKNTTAGPGAGPAAGPAAGPLAPPPVASATDAAVGPNSGTSAYNQKIRDLLLQQIGGLSEPTTADSADVAPALSAYNTQSQRDQATNREALAERFYAGSEGGNALHSGGFNTSVQQGLERAAGDRANFTGSTVFQAAQQKRQQLQQMLQTATSAGLTDAAQQIQAKIAEIDADLRRQGLSQQNSQFGDSLGFNYAQLIAQQNRDALTAGLRG